MDHGLITQTVSVDLMTQQKSNKGKQRAIPYSLLDGEECEVGRTERLLLL